MFVHCHKLKLGRQLVIGIVITFPKCSVSHYCHVTRNRLITVSYKLLFIRHRSLIKKITQTAVINIVFQRIFIKLDVSYASQHTISKVTVTIFENYICIVNIRGLEPRLRKMICSSTCLEIMRSNS